MGEEGWALKERWGVSIEVGVKIKFRLAEIDSLVHEDTAPRWGYGSNSSTPSCSLTWLLFDHLRRRRRRRRTGALDGSFRFRRVPGDPAVDVLKVEVPLLERFERIPAPWMWAGGSLAANRPRKVLLDVRLPLSSSEELLHPPGRRKALAAETPEIESWCSESFGVGEGAALIG